MVQWLLVFASTEVLGGYGMIAPIVHLILDFAPKIGLAQNLYMILLL
jgi:hypothetical protein